MCIPNQAVTRVVLNAIADELTGLLAQVMVKNNCNEMDL